MLTTLSASYRRDRGAISLTLERYRKSLRVQSNNTRSVGLNQTPLCFVLSVALLVVNFANLGSARLNCICNKSQQLCILCLMLVVLCSQVKAFVVCCLLSYAQLKKTRLPTQGKPNLPSTVNTIVY